MKKLISAVLAAALLIVPAAAESNAASGTPSVAVDATSAILMEKESGAVLYENNVHEKLEPASVTKVMTILLVMEAIDSGALSLDDVVTASAHAVSMGGSQVYLKENEQMTVRDMLKAVAVVSGNDAAVALAEHIAGSEEHFVSMMNERAAQLGMTDTTFLNCTGLPAAGHVTSAYDIALMSRELILNHPAIREYTTIWMDSLRDGAFQLSNTNRLIRFYDGATGLKTGSTDTALYCLSATAERDDMELIAVVMKSPTSDARFTSAQNLLNFGFSNYTLVSIAPKQALPPIDVLLGEKKQVQPVLPSQGRILVSKADAGSVNTEFHLSSNLEAPVEAGQKIGELVVYVGGEEAQRLPVCADEAVARITVPGIFGNLLGSLFY
ncbi:MAG: D-alanyl-D-alanine carboxypeptidase [Oscillospiraceae bacterium]|nr:D-alanyl-D-alanine carboxypeptidase [Oscillospiraceae bacterium]